MSHFVVLVFGEDFEKQLAPYQENNMGDCPQKYMEFTDQEDEFREEYDGGRSVSVVETPYGLKFPHDECFRHPKQDGSFLEYETVIPKHYTQREATFKEIYPTFEAFCKDWHGHDGPDEKTGRYGYWENPNAKWDWYQVGGRWRGYFPLKVGVSGALGTPGVFEMMYPDAHKPNVHSADQCRLCDIDVERARREAIDAARAAFALWSKHFTAQGRPEGFDAIRDRICGTGDDFDNSKMEEVRLAYREQPAIAAYMSEENASWECPVDRFGFDEGACLARAANKALVPFAILINGNWHERGSMGWWGVVTDEKDEDEWCARFHALLSDLPPETRVTAVDCHI